MVELRVKHGVLADKGICDFHGLRQLSTFKLRSLKAAQQGRAVLPHRPNAGSVRRLISVQAQRLRENQGGAAAPPCQGNQKRGSSIHRCAAYRKNGTHDSRTGTSSTGHGAACATLSIMLPKWPG